MKKNTTDGSLFSAILGLFKPSDKPVINLNMRRGFGWPIYFLVFVALCAVGYSYFRSTTGLRFFLPPVPIVGETIERAFKEPKKEEVVRVPIDNPVVPVSLTKKEEEVLTIDSIEERNVVLALAVKIIHESGKVKRSKKLRRLQTRMILAIKEGRPLHRYPRMVNESVTILNNYGLLKKLVRYTKNGEIARAFGGKKCKGYVILN